MYQIGNLISSESNDPKYQTFQVAVKEALDMEDHTGRPVGICDVNDYGNTVAIAFDGRLFLQATNITKKKIILTFVSILLKKIEDSEPQFSKLVDEHLWELI